MCAVYIDGEYALKLDMQTLQENHIAQGDTLTDEQLKMLIDQSDLRRAKEKALWLLSYRDHSKKELVDKPAPNRRRRRPPTAWNSWGWLMTGPLQGVMPAN